MKATQVRARRIEAGVAGHLTKRERKLLFGRGVGPHPMGSDKFPQIARGVCIAPHRGPDRLPKATKFKGWQRQLREAR